MLTFLSSGNIAFVQLLSHVWLFATSWTATCLPFSLSFTVSCSLLKHMSIELVMPSHHLILCGPLSLLPWVFPSIMIFSNESVLHIQWPKYWSFSPRISRSNKYSGLISFKKRMNDTHPMNCFRTPYRKLLSLICVGEILIKKDTCAWDLNIVQKVAFLDPKSCNSRRQHKESNVWRTRGVNQ